MLNLVEDFVTIGGEAPLIGEPIYLIRLSGCNLNCKYCDTKYNDEINETISRENLIKQINKKLSKYPTLKILFTGGEPLLKDKISDIKHIIQKLNNYNFYVETNGSVFINDILLKNSNYIIDWKTPSSGESDSFEVKNLSLLRKNKDRIKFVISKEDLDWIKTKINYIKKINNDIDIYISPQKGNIELHEISDFILKNKIDAKISFQLHKIIWPNIDRGV